MDLKVDWSLVPDDYKEELLQLLADRDELIKYNKLASFEPYKFQEDFYTAGSTHRFRFLCAANRVGKSFSEAAEVSYHLTGLYPDWWRGRRFNYPILLWCVGITGDSTKKVLQKELFGTPMAKDKEALGTGAIPRNTI
ncbi:MAG: hypothetical protein ACRCZZ_07615, partial [Phocaeicola sp.]